MKADPRNTRPGGTISGPAMFTLADFGVCVAIIASLGETGFEAVIASSTVNFLASPRQAT
jgi:acyl-coenzyme A thioesterase PaaI-like protein